MAERAHPDDPAFHGTIYEQRLRDRYTRCQSAIRGKKALDAPCGTGWGTSLLQDAASVVGIDLDVDAVRYGQKHFPGISFLAGNLAELPFASESFDCVLCLEGLEHLFRTEAAAFLKEAHRVLRDGGRLMVTVPFLHDGRHSGNPWHLFEYVHDDIEAMLNAWFETVELKEIDGPEGPEIWYSGFRRNALASQPIAQVESRLAENLVSATTNWVRTLTGPTGVPFTPGGDATVISTSLAILHIESAQALADIPDQQRDDWLKTICAAQQPSSGLFQEPLLERYAPGLSHDAEYLRWQTTYFALAALDALGMPARHRLTFLDAFLKDGAVEAWLTALDWRNPWLESNRVMFLLHACIYAVERQNAREFVAVYHRVLDWLDRCQDASTGLWGTDCGASLLNAVAGAYHFIPFYEYVHRPISAVNRIIDSTLNLQQADGLFGPELGGGACEDLDAIDVLATLTRHTPHRSREIRRVLVRAWWAIWNLHKADGSFPYVGKVTDATYSFSGWEPLTAGLHTGDIWSTLSRMHTLATIAAAYPGDVSPFRWQWRRWPALGYRSDGVITDSGRESLPLWLRRLPLSPPEHAQITVVIPCYNLGRYLHEAIASVAAQTLRAVRVVVVDDGSTDAFTKLLFDHWPYDGVELLRLENKGVATARNEAIARAASEYICCLDADDRLRPAFLERAIAVLAGDPGIGFVSCFYELFDNDHGVYRYTDCNLPAMLARNEAVISSVFRRAAWKSAGGYSPELTGMHDWDLWIGILEQDYRGAVLPEVLFDYRSRPGSMYSQTVQPANYARLNRRIVERHENLFRKHLADVIALKARQFTELVLLRASEHNANRTANESMQKHIQELASTISGQANQLALLEEGKRWNEQQALNWQNNAEHYGVIVAGLEQQIAALKGRKTKRNSGRSMSGNGQMQPPGLLKRFIRNAALIGSAITSQVGRRNLALWGKVLSNAAHREVWNRHFDHAYYTELNGDVFAGGVSPALHYVVYGAQERRQCSASFDSQFYLRRHPDVAAQGVAPLLHWVLFGSAERRMAAPTSKRLRVPAVLNRGGDPPPARTLTATPSVESAPRFRSFALKEDEDADSPLVSVVIPCFNYGHYVAEAIDSVQRQTLPTIETIVVEGGSTDGTTPGIVKQIEQTGLPKTRFLYQSEPQLTGANRNFGIQEARGKYICCLDADDKLHPVYLEVATFLAETYGYDLVYPSVQAFGIDTWEWKLNDPDPMTIADYNQLSTVAMFRRTAWEDAGGFRDFGQAENYVAEDWEMWVRMLRSGFRAKCIPECLHHYRVHKTGIWHRARNQVESQRQRIVETNSELLSRDVPIRNLAPQGTGWRALLDKSKPGGSILLALPFVAIGGAERIFEAIIRRAAAEGRRVVVITTLPLPESIKSASAHFQSLTPHFYDLPALFEEDTERWDDFVSYLIDQYSIDLVMISGCDYLYRALPELVAAFPRLAVVDQLFNDQVHFPTNRHYSQYIDISLVPSVTFANRIVHEFGESIDRVAVIPHGVEIPPAADLASIAAARERSGLPPEWKSKFIVGFFGRMSAEKAPLDFVETVKTLGHKSGMAFVMTGEGPELEKVHQRIADYRIADLIFTPGFVENPRDLMLAVDVIVVPSRLDGMPLVVMESQALGKPVIASAVGSIPRMVEHGETGLLCEPGDISAFAQGIREFHASPDLREKLGRAGRDSVRRNHSLELMLRRYQEAFESARAIHRTRRASESDPAQ